MAIRYDSGSLKLPKKLPNGFLKVDGYLTRVGVFVYRFADGQERRELRHPEEVFKADSLDTLSLAPLTLQHPRDPVTVDNARDLSVGSVGNVRVDQDRLVRADMVITDPDAIQAVVEDRVQEVSCGYSCDVVFEEGEFNGERYDAIQKNIVYNHAAFVDRGRAGPEVSVRLDSEDAILVDYSKEEKIVKKINIDGVDYEVSEQAYQAINKVMDRVSDAEKRADEADKAASEYEAKFDQEKDRADSAEKALDQEKKLRADAESQDRVEARVAARLDLERAAALVLDDKEFSGKSDRQVQEAVIVAISPSAQEKLDSLGASDKDDAYVAARFEQALETYRVDEAAAQERKDLQDNLKTKRTVERKEDADDSPAAKFAKAQSERWKLPLKASKDADREDVSIRDRR